MSTHQFLLTPDNVTHTIVQIVMYPGSPCMRCGFEGPDISPAHQSLERAVNSEPSLTDVVISGDDVQNPPDFQANHVRENLSGALRDIASLDKRIESLTALLSQLCQEREDRQASADTFRSLLTPINRLPPEIVSQIFLDAVDDIPLYQGDSLDISRGPWPLAQVCSRWRDIGVSLPRLWSHVEIYPIGLHRSAGPILDTWLSRSHNFPLSISIVIPRNHSFQPHIDKIISQSHRWVTASVGISSLDIPCLSALKGRLPSLQTLVLDLHDFNPLDLEATSSFDEAPALRDLELLNITISHLMNFRISWSQLTRFVCNSGKFILYEIIDVLRHMSSLVSFETYCTCLSVDNDARLHPLTTTMPSLRRMSCGFSPWVFKYLVLPALEEIVVLWDSRFRFAPFLDSLLRRSSCSLQVLHMKGGTLLDDDIIRTLTVAPSITTFHLTDACEDSEVVISNTAALLSQLTHRASQETCLAPNLTSFTLSILKRRSFDISPFLDMVESRWRNAAPDAERTYPRLREMHLITKPRIVSDGAFGRLWALNSEGMHFRHDVHN